MLQPGLAGHLTMTIAAEHTAHALGNPGVHAVASPTAPVAPPADGLAVSGRSSPATSVVIPKFLFNFGLSDEGLAVSSPRIKV